MAEARMHKRRTSTRRWRRCQGGMVNSPCWSLFSTHSLKITNPSTIPSSILPSTPSTFYFTPYATDSHDLHLRLPLSSFRFPFIPLPSPSWIPAPYPISIMLSLILPSRPCFFFSCFVIHFLSTYSSVSPPTPYVYYLTCGPVPLLLLYPLSQTLHTY